MMVDAKGDKLIRFSVSFLKLCARDLTATNEAAAILQD